MTLSRHIRPLLAFAFLGLAACGTSPENEYYVLTPTENADAALDQGPGGAALPDLTIAVPAYLDRAQIVFIDADGKVDIHEFDRWAEPIDGMIRRVLLQDMQAHPVAHAGHRAINMTIDSFVFDDDNATLKAHWTAVSRDGKNRAAPVPHDFAASVAVIGGDSGSDLSGYTRAMSELLGNLAQKANASGQ